MITYTGVHVTKEFGAPTVRGIAVQSMRLPRFCGNGEVWYPVGIHLLLVAALVPPELEAHALLHDAAEVCVNDVPRPMKTKAAKALEKRVLKRIYHSLGIAFPSVAEQEEIHRADIRAVNVEGRFSGVRGYIELQPAIDYKDMEAVKAWKELMTGYDPAFCLDANGHWVRSLESRLRVAIARVHKNYNAVKSYTSAA